LAAANLKKPWPGWIFCYLYFITDPLLDPIRTEVEYKPLIEKARTRHEEFKRKFFAE